MLIDINARIGQWPYKKVRYNTCKTLLERMNRFGVERSVISSFNGIFYKNTQAANEDLYNEIRSQKEFQHKFIPLAVINPSYANWERDLDTCRKKWGMKGVCLYPNYHDYDIKEAFVAEIVKAATQLDMVVSLTVRMLDSRQNSWLDPGREETLKDFIPLIAQNPGARFIIGNVANTGSLTADDIATLKKADLLMDTSGRVFNGFKGWLDRYGAGKFAFGSHAPLLDYISGRLRFELLNSNEISEQDLRKIRGENAMRLLKL